MRADQFAALVRLQEEITDEFIAEAEPKDWPGRGKKIGEMRSVDRGDLLWCKKNAAHSLTLVLKITHMIAAERAQARNSPLPPESDDGTHEDGQKTEREAEDDIDRNIVQFEALAEAHRARKKLGRTE